MKYIDILYKILKGEFVYGRHKIVCNGQIDIQMKLVNDKINIVFGENKPTIISNYLIRIKSSVNHISFEGDMMYLSLDNFIRIPISVKDLEEMA